MNEQKIKKELYSFYLHGDAERSQELAQRCFSILDGRYREGMSVTEQKLLQYDVICEEFEPTVFRYNPYFYETGVLTSLSDGVSKEDLLDAQKHPEKYPHLIVRVTGFSAKFTSLTREWQDEVISRNFYD